MEIIIERIGVDSAPTLERLYLTYLQEMSLYFESGSTSTDVTLPERTLRKYWNDSGHWAYLIVAHQEVAGFCLVRGYPGEPGTNDIEQFFISEKFKRQGVGRLALRQVLEAHPGNWIVRVLKQNKPALQFWPRAIEACVGSRYTQKFELDESLEMHFIRFQVASG